MTNAKMDKTQRELSDVETNQLMAQIESIIYAYALYDNKAKKFDTPFFCHNDFFAGRHYKMVTAPDNKYHHMFIDEFDLYRLASYDQLTGQFEEELELIITGKKEE